MGQIDIHGSELGNALSEMLTAQDIIPGDQPSYDLAKTIYLYHPLGAKMAEAPINMAMSQAREISIPKSPEERVRDKFVEQWKADGIDFAIFNVMTLSRVYGIASVALVIKNVPPREPLDPTKLADQAINFAVFDPLNTAGSLVLNQNPAAFDFLKVDNIAVSGESYHPSRAVTMMHGQPIYISYTSSAFGFVGRSCYQRALFPLKSFVETMVTDDLIVKKAGVFIATLKTAGAIIDAVMQKMAGMKRLFVKQATSGNVISIGIDEKIETLNMQNIDGAYGMARKNILENIAVSDDMPAKLLNSETFAEGFGEGSEDAKQVARYVDRYRERMEPLYKFFDRITMRRAWNEDFFKSVQAEFPVEYGEMRYEDAFYQWSNSFTAAWPSLLTEPESEKVKTDDVKLKAIIAAVEVFAPEMDPENKAELIAWAVDNINENKMMFQTPLVLDIEALKEYEPPAPPEMPGMPKPFAASDSQGKAKRRKAYDDSVADLITMMQTRERPKANGYLNGHA